MNETQGNEVWYQCDRCTACCRWPGDVKVEAAEVDRIAAFMGLDVDVFVEKFTRLRMNRNGLSLIEKDNDECIMLENGKCLIQAVKPYQCKGFPNRWNFNGWREVCQAKEVPLQRAIELGLVEDGQNSADKEWRGRDLS